MTTLLPANGLLGTGLVSGMARALPLFCGVVAGAAFAGAADSSTLRVPVGTAVTAQAAIGQGTAQLTADASGLTLAAEATATGRYAENWYLDAAVFDLLLPDAVPLPVECAKLSLGIVNSYEKNQHPPASLRVLVRDARGGVWAVNTRLRGLGALPLTKGVERIETFPWDASEAGRIDPWVMMALDPVRFDEYDPPQPPLVLAGFRVIVPAVKKVSFEVRDLTVLSRGQLPDPYWCLGTEGLWKVRLNLGDTGQFGWGPGEPGPHLRAADLGLSQGEFPYSWEILGMDEWTVERAGSGVLAVAADGSGGIEFPLLANGTYRLRLCVRPGKSQPLREFFMHYLVVRNSRGPSTADRWGPAPRLRFSAAPTPGNVFAPEAAATAAVTVSCAADSATAATAGTDTVIRWQVESTDGRELAKGEAAANQSAVIVLAEFAAREPVLWITARLLSGGQEPEVARRVVGFRAKPVLPPSAAAAPDAKLAPFANAIPRTKGDWHEGGTPVATQATLRLTQFQGWLDEAREIGYNQVEFSAPWFDLEPLPGVYQFQYLDRLVDEAKTRGLFVVFRVHPIPGQVPGWVPREYQEDENRLVHGLWSGGSNLTYTAASSAMTGGLDRFLENLGAHFRDNPQVMGYTVENLFFDHGWHDMPWLAQYVDYSETMRRAFVAHLRGKYHDDLRAVAAAHQVPYQTWEDVSLPHPTPAFDELGRLRPRTDALWLDWARFKVDLLCGFRLDAVRALRRGDPGCAVGSYAAPDTQFCLDDYAAMKSFIPTGSMEDQYPPEPWPVPVRREPHGKIARTAPLVDVGMTNLLFHEPGHEGLFNYWFPEWRLKTLKDTEREAELRLQQWFRVVDRLAGAEPCAAASQGRGLQVWSIASLLLNAQHTFIPRAEDWVKPYRCRVGAEKLRVDELNETRLTPGELRRRPYVYLPYCADVLDTVQAQALCDYVQQGGRLILEPTSGFWRVGAEEKNVLGGLLGLAECAPNAAAAEPGDAVTATVQPGSVLDGVPLAFRVRQFKPPINDQPTPWIQNIPRAYFRRYALTGTPPEGAEVAARFADGTPAALMLPHGKGTVLFFCGVVDWLACPGLARRTDDWGCGRPPGAAPAEDPELLTSPLRKGETLYVLGRRFINHADLGALKGGNVPESVKTTKALAVLFPHAAAGRYRVRECLSEKDLGTLDGPTLRTQGVTLELTPGQGLLLEAVPAR